MTPCIQLTPPFQASWPILTSHHAGVKFWKQCLRHRWHQENLNIRRIPPVWRAAYTWSFHTGLSAVVVEERFWVFKRCIPFIRGDPGVLPRKILEHLECRKSHLPHFFRLILYILRPHYSLISNFFAYHSLISIKNGHYSLISKPHPDPLIYKAHIYPSIPPHTLIELLHMHLLTSHTAIKVSHIRNSNPNIPVQQALMHASTKTLNSSIKPSESIKWPHTTIN